MKSLISLALFIQLAFCTKAQQANETLGNWLTEDAKAKVHIFSEKGKYCGRIIWVEDSTKSIKLNTFILSDFIFDIKEKEWKTGTIYNPKHGHNASGYLVLKDSKTLKVVGYKGFRWIDDSEISQKLNDE